MSIIVRSTISHRQPVLAPLAQALAGLAARAARAVQRGISAWSSRNDVAALARLDERMLADMGLTRSDIRDAIAQPLWSDATAVLAQRRRERQVHDYRAIFAQLMRERNSIPPAPGADACCYPSREPPARLAL